MGNCCSGTKEVHTLTHEVIRSRSFWDTNQVDIRGHAFLDRKRVVTRVEDVPQPIKGVLLQSDTHQLWTVPFTRNACTSSETVLLHHLQKTKIIDLSGAFCTIIVAGFGSNLPCLTVVNLSEMVHCQRIGAHFCNNNKSLTTVNISGMVACQVIEGNFCFNCRSLTQVKMDELPNCHLLGENFCHTCPSLAQLNLSGMPSCAYVSKKFCHNSSKLQVLNLTNLGCVVSPSARMPIMLNQLTKIATLRTIYVDGGLAETLAHQGAYKFRLELAISNWSWSGHFQCSRRVRFAVLCVYEGITFQDRTGEQRFLPSELAGVICSYFPTTW